MTAMKRALLAGTILPGLLVAPAFAQVLRMDAPVLLAQAEQPDPRRPGGRPGAPPPQQARPPAQVRPPVAPVQPRAPVVQQP
ncbi:MAG: hypothetical protein Q8S29_08195, partial [Phreatobacter sp.]|nr:hypothetical protein [Phreatobacter sp.]